MNKFRKHTILFILVDALTAMLTWVLFFFYRKTFIEPDKFGYDIPIELDQNFYMGMLYIPIYWLALYFLTGVYKDVWRKSRIKEIANTLTITILGVTVLFFALLLDDEVRSYEAYYKTFFVLLMLHFGLTSFERIVLATYIKRLLVKRSIGFKTIVAGNNAVARKIVDEINSEKITQGYLLEGFVDVNGGADHLGGVIPYLGTYEQLPELIHQNKIEEVIIALDSSKHEDIIKVSNLLEDEGVIMKIVPDMYDVLSGTVKMQNIMGTALIEINHEIMPQWQKVTKRLMDLGTSLFMLLVFSPLYLALGIMVKLSSKGPVFFSQERIGLHGNPFRIIKFRTMYTDAEAGGPALSSSNDSRITKTGRWLRKYRLDELPQFYNVLIGDMSLVGPRPERKFFIDQIVKVAPHYRHLQRVRPGITSWGQVKYGYAENVDQMVERLKFDIIYIENMSLGVDFRILIYTVITIVQGRGK